MKSDAKKNFIFFTFFATTILGSPRFFQRFNNHSISIQAREHKTNNCKLFEKNKITRDEILAFMQIWLTLVVFTFPAFISTDNNLQK